MNRSQSLGKPIALESIAIQGFKSIKSTEVFLTNTNILIGANGAGKSNILQVFSFLKQVFSQNLQRFTLQAGGAELFLFGGAKQSESITITLSAALYNYHIQLIAGDQDQLIVAEERVSEVEDGSGWVQIAKNQLESLLSNQTIGLARKVISLLAQYKVYHFHDTSSNFAAVKRTCKVFDSAVLHSDAGNLAAILYKLKLEEPAYYKKLIQHIQLVLPYFFDFVLEPQGPNKEDIRLLWQTKGSEYILPASAFSDGSLRFICLATLLLQPKFPDILIIDEPELGLHPNALNYLSAMIQSAAEKTQLIVSTQAVGIVNNFGPEDIIVVENSLSEGTTASRLKPENLEVWLEDYALGEVWQRNLIGG